MLAQPGQAGVVKVMNAAPLKGEAAFFVIHRAEVRGVVLNGNEVAWVTSIGEFETEFYFGQEESREIAAMFFSDLVEGHEDVTWANSTDDERWYRNGEAVRAS